MEDVSADALRRQLEVNVVSQHELARRLIPAMRKRNGGRGEGRIVQCSSVLGLVAAPFRGSYCASKFALEALTDAMRLELFGTGIHVSLIEPGPIRTRFVENALENLKATVDIGTSPHADKYRARLESMAKGGATAFKLEPEAVVQKLIHAVESARPRRRYYVTVPTYFAAFARRFLPPLVADWLARRN
jgi:NAD(P)-dependent dehydrogenase (short-subunit alcohol dehydrogenase family)